VGSSATGRPTAPASSARRAPRASCVKRASRRVRRSDP
jgi:hypothetical protein